MGSAAKLEYLKEIKPRYQRADKQEKGRILDEFCRVCQYHRKNDNAHVEQKNWTHVRQLVGYDRLADRRFVALLNNLYTTAWNPLQNCFTPVMKPQSKERVGAKVIKHYDQPQTPCQRLLASSHLSATAKRQLEQQLATLNPLKLMEAVEWKLQAIAKLLTVTTNVRQR